jgi:membrane protease YdiL (CAAX protease family)
MLAGTSWKDLVASLFIVALVAGTGEEFFFRGLLQRILITGWTKQPENGSLASCPKGVIHAVIWIVAFLFSAIHLQFFGFFPRLLLGAWFGYLLWWTGSIWVPVAAHVTITLFLRWLFSPLNMAGSAPIPINGAYTRPGGSICWLSEGDRQCPFFIRHASANQ